MDPLGSKIGGIATFIRNFIKYSPEDFSIEFVGVSSNKGERQLGKWHEMEYHNREFKFLPVSYVVGENVRPKVPLSLRFTTSLFRYKHKIPLDGRSLEFHRVEPSLPFRRCSSPKILFVHGHMGDIYNPHTEVRWAKIPGLYFRLEKRLIDGFERIYVVREDGVEFYKEKYPDLRERFRFLPTWVDDEVFYPYSYDKRQLERREFCRRHGFSEKDRFIIFVGRLEKQKDPLLVVGSFYALCSRIENAKLIIVGTGSLERQVRNKVLECGLEQKVTFTGSLPQSKVADIMRISDVFLLTSAFEGMPRSVLEALGCGLPVVTTDVGEVKRVVKEGFSGIVCDRREPKVISEALNRVLESDVFTCDNCLVSVEPYKAREVLQELYQFYYHLAWRK